MQFEIMTKYQEQVDLFLFLPECDESSRPANLEALVALTGHKIKAVCEMKLTLESMAKRKLSLLKAVYICVQSEDKDAKIVDYICNTTEEDSKILTHIVNELLHKFHGIKRETLEKGSLLFAITFIKDPSKMPAINLPLPPMTMFYEDDSDLDSDHGADDADDAIAGIPPLVSNPNQSTPAAFAPLDEFVEIKYRLQQRMIEMRHKASWE